MNQDSSRIRIKRATRAKADAAAVRGELLQGEPLLITDEGRLAVATSTNLYESTLKQSEVTSSSFDTTANKITKVGDFGIGNIQTTVITGDWNTFPSTFPGNGIVGLIQAGQTNAPDALFHYLEQKFFNNQVIQIAWPYRVTTDLYFKIRSRFDGTWTAWKEIYSESTFIYAQNTSGASVASNATVAGSGLSPSQTGTWRNVTGASIANSGYGLWKIV